MRILQKAIRYAWLRLLLRARILKVSKSCIRNAVAVIAIPRWCSRILYAYINNVYSYQKIEKLLHRDIHYIWLTWYEKPDFITINRFRNRMKKDINEVFTPPKNACKNDKRSNPPLKLAPEMGADLGDVYNTPTGHLLLPCSWSNYRSCEVLISIRAERQVNAFSIYGIPLTRLANKALAWKHIANVTLSL